MRRGARAVAIAAVVVIVAVLSGLALREWRAGSAPAASPIATISASPAVASATPTAGPTATLVTAASPSPAASGPSDRYGYVFVFENDADRRIFVRRETDLAPQSMQGATSPTPGPPVFELRGTAPAVSADGKRLAYWRLSADGVAKDLRVLDVADPASDRSVLMLTGETLGGGIVWSNDALGLLIATYKSQLVNLPGGGGCPRDPALVMVDLATTPASTRDAGKGGCAMVPIAWDRPGRISAGYVTGPGGYAFEYATWNGNAADQFANTPMPGEALADQIEASGDAKFVLAIDLSKGSLRVWPTGDNTKVETITRPSRITAAFWRPGTAAPYEVIVATAGRAELLRYPGGAARTIHTGTAQLVGADAVRPDGSAVVVTESGGGPPPPTTTVLIVDVATAQATKLSTTAGSLGSGVRLASARGVFLR